MTRDPGERGALEFTLDAPWRTERLVLRGLEPRDAEALLAYRSLPEVARYVPFEPMTAEEIAERLAGRWALRRIADAGEGVVIGFERADTSELIGDVSLWAVSTEHRSGEVGWLQHPAQGGHGYATEAVRAVLAVAFEALGLHRVIARVDARNHASLRLCERLGMRREGVLRENEWFKGEWTDEIDYALLEDEWGSGSGHGEGAGSIGGRSA